MTIHALHDDAAQLQAQPSLLSPVSCDGSGILHSHSPHSLKPVQQWLGMTPHELSSSQWKGNKIWPSWLHNEPKSPTSLQPSPSGWHHEPKSPTSTQPRTSTSRFTALDLLLEEGWPFQLHHLMLEERWPVEVLQQHLSHMEARLCARHLLLWQKYSSSPVETDIARQETCLQQDLVIAKSIRIEIGARQAQAQGRWMWVPDDTVLQIGARRAQAMVRKWYTHQH